MKIDNIKLWVDRAWSVIQRAGQRHGGLALPAQPKNKAVEEWKLSWTEKGKNCHCILYIILYLECRQ